MDIGKLTVPLALVGSLVTAAAGAGGAIMVTKEKIDTVVRDQAETSKKVQRLEEKRGDQAVQVGRLEEKVDGLKQGMDRIERALGTRP